MPDNVPITPGSGATIATDDVAGVQFQRVKVTLGGDGVDAGDVAAGNPLPVSGPLTDGQLRATPVPVSGSVTISDGSGPVTVDGAVTVSGAVTATGPLTDAELRAAAVSTRVASYNYPISTANSSTTQLAAGATFTGAWESPQDQPSVSILLTSDQPTTITVRQAIDAAGAFQAPPIVFYVPAGQGFARSLTINGNFVRITAQNTGPSTTTTFNLNVAFGNLGDADATGVQPVTELPLVLTGQAAQTATVNNILEPTAGAAGTAVSSYRSASVQVVSTGTGGSFIFEQSNDGVNWRPLPVFNAELVDGAPITAAITATVSQIIYTFPLRGNFLRLRIVSTITGGSIIAFTRLSTEPWTTAAQLVASSAAANLRATVSGSAPSASGTITALNGAVTLDLNGASAFAVDLRGTFSATVTFQGTVDGTNWFAVNTYVASGGASQGTVATATATGAWMGNCSGLLQVRAIATAFTSGSITALLRAVQSSGVAVSVGASNVLSASAARVGFIAASGIWYDDSATALAANATFTGTSRDATLTATATAFANAATYAQEVRLSAESDVSGTLWLEVSRDNTNWRRVKSVATAAVTGGGQYAEIVHRPSWRYWRVGFTNGATLQTRFSIGSIAMA